MIGIEGKEIECCAKQVPAKFENMCALNLANPLTDQVRGSTRVTAQRSVINIENFANKDMLL